MCIYLTLPYLTYIQTPRTPKYRDEGREENFPAELFIMHTISLSEACLSLFWMKSTYIQKIYLAPHNVISYDVCDVLVVHRH